MDPSESNLRRLCLSAFDQSSADSEASRASLKMIANILLLHQEARQTFVDIGRGSMVSDRIRATEETPENEIVCSRILFLLTFGTSFDFNDAFDHHGLSTSLEHNMSQHAARYSKDRSGHEKRTLAHHGEHHQSPDDRALGETLKLLFNLTQFYPDRTHELTKILPSIMTIILRIPLSTPTLQPPLTNLINVLLSLDIQEQQVSQDGQYCSPLFPAAGPAVFTRRLITILEAGLRSEEHVEKLESTATPLVSVLRRINEIAPSAVRALMQGELLPTHADRSQPLGKSDTLSSRLLRLSTSPSSPHLKEAILSLLFELSDKDAITFIRNVSYGFAAGFLMTHKINVLNHGSGELDRETTRVDGVEVNPITGQRRDMEAEDLGPEMTDEEKEREAERLFVLFERLKATGVIDVTNPVELAQQQGRFEEVE